AVLAHAGMRASLAIGAVLATIGAGIVRGRPELGFTLGELLTIGSAVAFAAHILLTDRVTRRLAPMPVTLTSFACVALISLSSFGVAQAVHGAPDVERIGELLGDARFATNLVWTATFATVVALTLMNLFQREIDPVRAAILYALEPIWAAVFG